MLRSALDIIFISSYAASRRAGGGGSTSRLYYGEYSDAFLSAATCTSFVLAEAKCIHLLCLEDDDFLLFSIHTSFFSHILYSSVSTVCLQHISFCLFFFFLVISCSRLSCFSTNLLPSLCFLLFLRLFLLSVRALPPWRKTSSVPRSCFYSLQQSIFTQLPVSH